MNTMEVLTLLLVVFAALSYIDNHNKKKQHPRPSKVEDAILCSLTLLRANRITHPITFLSKLYMRVLDFSSALFDTISKINLDISANCEEEETATVQNTRIFWIISLLFGDIMQGSIRDRLSHDAMLIKATILKSYFPIRRITIKQRCCRR